MTTHSMAAGMGGGVPARTANRGESSPATAHIGSGDDIEGTLPKECKDEGAAYHFLD